MQVHVVVGAGPVGAATAELLAALGHEVRVVSRAGRGPLHPGIELVSANAADPHALGPVARGAAVLYNCANPSYHRWASDWPPLAASMLETASTEGSVLVTMGNLYAYGPVAHPIHEHDELAASGQKGRVRAAMWASALAAHEAGRVRATEARASDFFGPRVRATAHLGERVVPNVLREGTIRVLGDPSAPHSWTYLPDAAAALVRLGEDERAWGHAWHVPTAPPVSFRAVVDQIAVIGGVRAPRVRGIPSWAVRLGGLAFPLLRELGEVAYQFDQPFVVDSTMYTEVFGVVATPFEEALATTVRWWEAEAAPGRS